MRISIFPFAALLLTALLSTQNKMQKEINSYNVPDELRACFRSMPALEFNSDINPFYISADYNGDGITDFAAQVKTRKDHREGILFCLTKGGTVLVGAGAPVVWPQGNTDRWPFDSWILIRKGSKHLSIYPHIKSDVLALTMADVGGGLLYWDGTKFRWQQEE